MTWPNNAPMQKDDDAAAGIEVTDDFEPFSQRNDVFTRAFWDDSVKSKHTNKFFAFYRMEAAPHRGDGLVKRTLDLETPRG